MELGFFKDFGVPIFGIIGAWFALKHQTKELANRVLRLEAAHDKHTAEIAELRGLLNSIRTDILVDTAVIKDQLKRLLP